MNLFNKIKWVLGILVVFLIVLSTNLIDRNNFERVNNSVISLYEDRLVVKGILFDLSNLLHKKESAFLKRDTAFFIQNNQSINQSFDELILTYSQKKLSNNEKKTLNKFIFNLNKLMKMEGVFLPQSMKLDNQWMSQMEKTKLYLNNLSKIQISEGNYQFSISKKAMNSVKLHTQIEIYLLIFLALLLQFLVIYSPSKKKN